MTQKLPCPNPACSHVFTAADVQGKTEVRCPRCGFQLRTRPAAAKVPVAKPAKGGQPPRPAKPAIKRATPAPPASVPVAQPVPVAKPAPAPVAQPLAPKEPAEQFDVELIEAPPAAPAEVVESPPPGSAPLIRTRARGRGWHGTRLLMALGALVTAACVVAVGYLGIVHLFSGSEGGPSILGPKGGVIGTIKTKNGNEKIFQLALADKVWVMDRDIKNKIKAQAGDTETWFAEAWQHNKDDVWFALVARDFGMQKPRDAAMVRVAVDKLEQLFGEAVEADARAEVTKFAGLPAQKLRFKGLIKSAPWRGDCYMFFKSGFAYWFFVSSPDIQAVEFWSEDLQREDVFSTQVVERRGWREQPAPTETFAAANGAFSLTGLEGVWEKQESRNEDERGLLLLLGRQKREKSKTATVLVYPLDHQPDLKEAVKAARADVEAKKKEENTNYKLVAATDVADGQAEAGESADFGNRPGRMADLCLKVNDDPRRYVLLGVVNEADACYVFRCECAWESRQIWRQDFLDVLRSLRLKKAAS